MYVGELQMTGPTCVPEAPVQFVHGLGTRRPCIGSQGCGTRPRFGHVTFFGGIEESDPRRRARTCGPWLRGRRILPARGRARLGIVDSVRTKSTIPWRLGND